jgi:hypothetical protein
VNVPASASTPPSTRPGALSTVPASGKPWLTWGTERDGVRCAGLGVGWVGQELGGSGHAQGPCAACESDDNVAIVAGDEGGRVGYLCHAKADHAERAVRHQHVRDHTPQDQGGRLDTHAHVHTKVELGQRVHGLEHTLQHRRHHIQPDRPRVPRHLCLCLEREVRRVTHV